MPAHPSAWPACVQAIVCCPSHDLEIGGSVVVLSAVDVVDHLLAQQWSTEHGLGDDAVFTLPMHAADRDVPSAVFGSSAVPRWVLAASHVESFGVPSSGEGDGV